MKGKCLCSTQRPLCLGKQSRAHRHTHPIRKSQREGSVEFDVVPSMPPQGCRRHSTREVCLTECRFSSESEKSGTAKLFPCAFYCESFSNCIYIYTCMNINDMDAGRCHGQTQSQQAGTAQIIFDGLRGPSIVMPKELANYLAQIQQQSKNQASPSRVSPHSPPRSSSSQPP